MRNPYSVPLYDLYKKARDWRDNFRKSVEFLIEDESGIDQFEKGLMGSDNPFEIRMPNMTITQTNIRTFEDEELRDAFSFLQSFRNDWRDSVEEILEKIPQISFRMRFEEPKNTKNVGIRMGYVGYEFSHDMDMFLDLFDTFDDEVDELYSIINDYEQSIYQSSDFEQLIKNPAKSSKKATYKLYYDEISGKLFINDYEVYRCNLESTLDKALLAAFKAENHTTSIKGNLASTKSKIRAPESLRNLMFSTGKGTFRIKPEITNEDLLKAGLNKQTIEQEFQTINNS